MMCMCGTIVKCMDNSGQRGFHSKTFVEGSRIKLVEKNLLETVGIYKELKADMAPTSWGRKGPRHPLQQPL